MILQLSRPVVQQLIRSGQLPATKVSRHEGWKVPQSAFEAWIHARYADTRSWILSNPPPLPAYGTDALEAPPGDTPTPNQTHPPARNPAPLTGREVDRRPETSPPVH